MKKKLVYASVISIFIILFFVFIYSYIFNINNDINFNKNSVKIDSYTIPERECIFVNGIITPQNSENISIDSTKGSIDKVSITNGQVVKKGEILFTYRNDQVTDQVVQLNGQIASANNQKKLLVDKQTKAKNQAVQGEVDNRASLEAQISSYHDQIDTLQNQMNTYQEQLKTLIKKEYTTITAPIDGKVILNDPGIDVSKPYIVIETTSFYIKGSISEKDQPKLKENQSADILVFASNTNLTGKVKTIGDRPANVDLSAQSSANGSSSNISYYNVVISLDTQENITNGFHVQATVYLSENSIKIPKSSIFQDNGKYFVYKVTNNVLIKQEIAYEDSASTDVVVTSGLKENDRIAKSLNGIKEGTSVE